MKTTQHTPAPPAQAVPRENLVLQRRCDCGGHKGPSGTCNACKHRRSVGAPSEALPPEVHRTLGTAGRAMDDGVRAFMEARFGHNFSQVRLHTDQQAARSARSVNALAYTVGPHIVFGGGRYAPGTTAGRRLLAHELTHTIQQGAAGPSPTAAAHQPLQRMADEAPQQAEASAAETARDDGVTPAVARQALERRIGADRLRRLEAGLLGDQAEAEATSVAALVAQGGTAPVVARQVMPHLQAAGPALPIAGAVLATALCAFGFFDYALNNFPGKSDKWKHCYTSCKIASWCAGPAGNFMGIGQVNAFIIGLGKEVLDAICDALGSHCMAEWGDVFANVKGIGCASVPFLPCDTCCDKAT